MTGTGSVCTCAVTVVVVGHGDTTIVASSDRGVFRQQAAADTQFDVDTSRGTALLDASALLPSVRGRTAMNPQPMASGSP
jgi:hypothetical protein